MSFKHLKIQIIPVPLDTCLYDKQYSKELDEEIRLAFHAPALLAALRLAHETIKVYGTDHVRDSVNAVLERFNGK